MSDFHAAPKSSRTVPFLEYARSARQDVAHNQVVDVLQVTFSHRPIVDVFFEADLIQQLEALNRSCGWELGRFIYGYQIRVYPFVFRIPWSYTYELHSFQEKIIHCVSFHSQEPPN